MLNNIRINNFKSLEDFEIEVKPLMLLFGQNSSGKSTFIKALMFLKENLFPLNADKTIFKIDKNIDLISYKDIVTNNSLNKNIEFEFSINGKYDFPKLDALKKDFYTDINFLSMTKNDSFPELGSPKEDHDKIIDLILNSVHKLDEYNFFKFYDKIINDWTYENINYSAIEFITQQINVNYTVKFEFINDTRYRNKHFKSIKFIDQTSGYYLVFNLEYDSFILNDLHLSNNQNINNLIREYFDEPYKYYNYPNIPSLLYFYENEHDYDINEYWDLMKILYCSYMLIPNILKSFFSYLHLPSLREIPEIKYLINPYNKDIDNKQYYGLLIELATEQAKLNNFFKDIVDKDNSYEEIEKIILLIEKHNLGKITNEDKLTLQKYVNQYFLSNPDMQPGGLGFFHIDHKTLKQQEPSQEKLNTAKINSFKENTILKINNDLRKIGINDFFLIYYDPNFEIAKLITLSKPNTQTYLSNASSGMIQLIPIICFLNIFKNDYNVYNFTFDKSMMFLYSALLYDIDNFGYYTILLEQPELHLHPRLQCKIGQLICENTTAANGGICMIIETHSEHIIRTIQLEIARGNFNKDLLGVYYFDKIEGTTKINKMVIDNNGLFQDNWPDGFFDDSVNLTMDLYEALRNKNN